MSDVPRLHQSIAHVLTSRSPLHAWQRHKELGATPSEPSEAKDVGSIIDKLILGGGPDVVIIQHENFKTKDAQNTREAVRKNGAIPVLARRYYELQDIAKAVKVQLETKGFTFWEHGATKLKLEWTDPVYGVACAGEIDHYDEPTIWDLKTTRDASPKALSRSVVEYGYDIQSAAYRQAIETLHHELLGRVRMLFLFVETEPPYAVTVAEPNGMMRAMGEHKWERACKAWRDCIASGVWPGYSDEVVEVEPKPWHLEEELQEAGDVIECIR
jgi:hypothetical protein